MTGDPKRTVRLDFGNLPLVEATVRVSFESPSQLTFETVNRVHEDLRDEFPQVSEPKQIEVAPGISGSTAAFGPGQISGVVYTGNAKGLIITIQTQVVVARWLKQVAKDDLEYPRFPSLREALWRAVDALKSERTGESPPIVVVNMSYVNFVRVAESDNVLTSYLSDLAQVEAAANARRIHKVEVSWQESESVDLRFNLERVTAQIGDESVEGYRLTTAAGMHLGDAQKAKEGLDDIHDRLQTFFLSLISDRAKTEWQLG